MKKHFIFALLLVFSIASVARECLSDYPPAEIKKIGANLYGVSPPYAGFDPCNESVSLKIISNSSIIFIIMHGGGGGSKSQTELANRLNKAGISTLTFDAFKMNKLSGSVHFWAVLNTTGPKQRMLYHSGIAAIKWMATQGDLSAHKIYAYGVSSGATAALNIAATQDLKNFHGSFMEGIAPIGIGLPDNIYYPVNFFFGRQDNYGGRQASEYVWHRTVPCSWNVPVMNTPDGNSKDCNFMANSNKNTQTSESYIAEQKSKGANISIDFFDGAGHDVFLGGMRTSTFQSQSGTLFSTLGANWGVSDLVFERIIALTKR